IELLRVFTGSQCAECHGLSFPTLEYRRTMGAGKYSYFRVDGSNRVEIAAIQALVLVHDQATDRFLLDVIECVLEDKLSDFFLAKFLEQFCADLLGNGCHSRLAC